jgi:hypothetical protein
VIVRSKADDVKSEPGNSQAAESLACWSKGRHLGVDDLVRPPAARSHPVRPGELVLRRYRSRGALLALVIRPAEWLGLARNAATPIWQDRSYSPIDCFTNLTDPATGFRKSPVI